ncbi:hypothetical protein AAHA92_19388 [Salvia divinorum]|uniref:Bifunctional inhibitor/plant lipid transfer protein/seed storage helical domain-containing protein n=1 Tax=Salvia divinorum TaxID=28513 RepID=A0ABD1H5U1_SALDI
MNPQNSNMVMVVMAIMISSLVVMSESAVELEECYKVWGDECKFGLLKEICDDPPHHPRNICCGLIADQKISWDCYYAIVIDLRDHYPCQHPDLAPTLATDMFADCMG